MVKFFKKNPELSRRFNQNYLNSLKCGEFKTLDIKKLQGYKKDYRLRIGKYRFLFVLENDQLLIYFYDADSRGGVYWITYNFPL